MNKPNLLLLILDGWGVREDMDDNAISKAKTPQWDKWQKEGCVSYLKASSTDVGLPLHQMGNSEVGHMHIGAGRIIKQNLSKISDEIENGNFYQNAQLIDHLKQAKQKNSTVHLMGLVSEGGVHSHQEHLFALLEVLEQQEINNSFVHAFLDGRDCAPTSSTNSIAKLLKKLSHCKTKLASLCGRFYAMDRDKRWDRIEKAYKLLTEKSRSKVDNPIHFIEACHKDNVLDEFIPPTALIDHQPINNDDLIIFFNFRADRARQLSNALSSDNFNEFSRPKELKVSLLTMTQYEPKQQTNCIYPPELPSNTLGECLSQKNMHQLRIAETEKYAHVTFFLNGGKENAFPLEERVLINSPDVKTYDLKPEMSAIELTDKLADAIKSEKYNLIICNYANADMVGHTGNFNAAVQSIEALDGCLKAIDEISKEHNTNIIVTADHGNAEKMFDEETQQAHTAHTTSLVPFIYIGSKKMRLNHNNGSLIDLAPTALELLNIKIPKEMTGRPLLEPVENT